MNDMKKELLMQRGFSAEEIENLFEDYRKAEGQLGKKWWTIENITLDEVINSDDIRILSRLFAKDSVKSHISNPFASGGFRFFSENENTFDRPIDQIEPYIACFVRAINKCGAHTGMSCDGWHSEYDHTAFRPMKIWMLDKYSTLWMWLIMEYVFGEKWSWTYNTWHDQWEPNLFEGNETIGELIGMQNYGKNKSLLIYSITRGHEREAYEKIYVQSQFLEKYCDELLGIRRRMIEKILSEKNDPEFGHNMRFLDIHSLMEKHSMKELENLGKAVS